MDITTFIAARSLRLQPVFIVQRDINVTCYVWELGSSPRREPIEITIKAGSEIVINEFSNFGDGWSMSLRKLSQYPKGVRKRASRWFKVNYSDMEYSHHVVIDEAEDESAWVIKKEDR